MNNEKDTGSFYFDQNGVLKAGNVPITDIVEKFISPNDLTPENVPIEVTSGSELLPNRNGLQTPLVVYSKKRLLNNISDYKKSFGVELTEKRGIESHISYALKANFNPSVLKLFHEKGTWLSLVNKNELKLALRVGFQGEELIFNGNGKKLDEIALVLRSGCFINIDSAFNLRDTLSVADKLKSELKRPAKLLLRVNVSTSTEVHSYLDTSGQSKFGIEADRLDSIIEQIKSNSELVRLAGFHIHLGSTISTIDIFRNPVANFITLINSMIHKHQLNSIELINFGGGLGIDYERFSYRTSETDVSKPRLCKYPTPIDLAQLIGENVAKINAKNFKVVVEPGRSLVGNAAILLTNLIGVKRNDNKNFLVVDASMCECIRPCLYSAYHHIDFISPLQTNVSQSNSMLSFDVVGPVCETGDFLGKNRHFRLPDDLRDVYMAVMDVGAYCSSMASNYNLHQKPAEVFIEEIESDDGSFKARYLLTRRPDTLDDILGAYTDY